jgi:hypothetical protein
VETAVEKRHLFLPFSRDDDEQEPRATWEVLWQLAGSNYLEVLKPSFTHHFLIVFDISP